MGDRRAGSGAWAGNRGLVAVALALAATFAAAELTGLDLAVQDLFYEATRGAWRVSSSAPLPRLVFYRLPKLALALLGLGALALAVWRRPARQRPGVLARLPRRHALFLFTTLAAVPLTVGLGKQVTGIYCPAEIERYGGTVPYYGLFEPVDPEVAAAGRGRCFPAAHASGGFALFAVAFVGRRRPCRAAWGLGAGWVMGLYQMARGAHYLSHTLVSMLIAWGLTLLLVRAFGLETAARARRWGGEGGYG
jgi:membrane-associated PAP2 superfamily phosphatase